MKKAQSSKAKRDKELLKQAENCHQNLMALAELLQGYVEAEWTRPDVIARAGKMISHEAEKLYDTLQTISEKLNQHANPGTQDTKGN